MRREVERSGVILEFVRIGSLIRVTALDQASLIEVVLQGPATAGEAALRRVVLQKLAYVLGGGARARGLARGRSML